MTQITSEIKINAPKEKVWATLANLGGIQSFHPIVEKSYYISDSREGIGATRTCEFKGGGAISERAIEWREGEFFTLEMHDGKKMPPFKTATGTQSVRSDGDGTIVGLTLEYNMKYGPIGSLMDAMLVKPKFLKVVPAILRGLKRELETH